MEMRDLCIENYKALMKRTEEGTNKGKDILCSWIEKINVVKISIPSKVVYRLRAFLIKILMAVFTEI